MGHPPRRPDGVHPQHRGHVPHRRRIPAPAGTDYVALGNEGITLSSGTFGTTYFTLTGSTGRTCSVARSCSRGRPVSRPGRAVLGATTCRRGCVPVWHFVDVVDAVLAAVPAAGQGVGAMHPFGIRNAMRRRSLVLGDRRRVLGRPVDRRLACRLRWRHDAVPARHGRLSSSWRTC